MKIENYKEITSAENKYLKLARSMVFKKNRLDEGLYIADGLRVVAEMLKDGDVKICFISHSRIGDIENNTSIPGLIKNKNIEVIVINDSLFTKIAPTDSPQGIAALCSLPKYQFDEKEVSVFSPGGRFLPILEGISDPGNLGTIIRLAAGMGLTELIITGDSADPYGPKAVRAASGLITRVKVFYHKDINAVLQRLKQLEFRILATDSDAEKSVRGYMFPPRTGLVLGCEARGISDDVEVLADEKLAIPLIDDVDSYNVATSAAIFFYEYISSGGK